jgi:hypothetical protein
VVPSGWQVTGFVIRLDPLFYGSPIVTWKTNDTLAPVLLAPFIDPSTLGLRISELDCYPSEQ